MLTYTEQNTFSKNIQKLVDMAMETAHIIEIAGKKYDTRKIKVEIKKQKYDVYGNGKVKVQSQGKVTIPQIQAIKKQIEDAASPFRINLILVDDIDDIECRQKHEVDTSTTLKYLLNHYADKRGISLRRLRFSYEGTPLFISSAGNKTFKELDIQDGGMIEIHDMNKSVLMQKPDDGDSSNGQAGSTTSKKNKSKKHKKAKDKNKKKKQQQQHPQPQWKDPVKTLEEYKVDHSKILTKIHEEARPKFKVIRQRLNNMLLARSKPKTKSTKKKMSSPLDPVLQMSNPTLEEGLGGKAGKTHYTIQVGEVANLYKTSKRHHRLVNQTQQKILKLDLHGLTKDDAMKLLDESLPTWHNAALAGSYPFVVPVEIICGGGSQILSEVVEDWIKCNECVCNMPKGMMR